MELWLTEKIHEKVGLTLKIKSILHSEATPSQRIEISETGLPSVQIRMIPFSISIPKEWLK